MKFFHALFVAILFLALPLVSAEAKPKANQSAEAATEPAGGGNSATHEGVEAAKAGNWDKAIESFKRAGSSDANDRHNLAVAYRQRGLAEVKKENWDGAISDFTEALKLKDDAIAHRFRAFAYMRKGDWNNALEDCNAVLKEKRTDVETLDRRGFVEMQLQQYDKAITDYTESIKQQPKNVEAYLGRSYVYELTNKIEPGLSDVEAVLRIQPTNSEAINRQKRLIAQKTKGQPTAASTPVLAGTPIPRKALPPSPPKPPPSPAAATTASPH